MTCCSALVAASLSAAAEPPLTAVAEPHRVDPTFVRTVAPGRAHIDILVPGMHCASCIWRVERALLELPGVATARANLTSHRVAVEFREGVADPDAVLAAIERLGYMARPFDAAAFASADGDPAGKELVRAMAVTGFAAGNIMLLSVSVWSGADAATRDLFHWISALIALPAIVYAGRPFFRSAWRALKARSLNMDVPISLGVILAAGMSLYETTTHGEHAWFDASVSLLFFLLVGRFLDHRMRDVARSAAVNLMSLSARSALRVAPDGAAVHVPIAQIVPGDAVRVAAGERVPVDGAVLEGESDIDLSMLTGESRPQSVAAGGCVFAGTLNLTGPLTVGVTCKSADTLLAEIVRLVEAAEQSSSRFVRLADRAARRYAPAVHILAATTLVGWLAAGAGWHAALTACVAVLIITCPCALGLAVPAVQVVASGFLLKRGIMLKDGAALEKLADIDTVVFDKTGTLTEGEPELVEGPSIGTDDWAIAAALGESSRHPLARGLVRAATRLRIAPASLWQVVEHPGCGMQGLASNLPVRLGRRDWVGGPAEATDSSSSEIWLRVGKAAAVPFRFEDKLRSDAADTVAALDALQLRVMLLSGDRAVVVGATAERAGISEWRSGCSPTDKAELLAELEKSGRRVLMVGDGINDAPALASAAVSMSPATASDISQTAAGIVFTGERLEPVLTAIRAARRARSLILQNFALAIGYNLVAVPIAMAGLATPLIAAIAMSTSSIIVTANALRLALLLRGRKPKRAAAPLVLAEALS